MKLIKLKDLRNEKGLTQLEMAKYWKLEGQHILVVNLVIENQTILRSRKLLIFLTFLLIISWG